MPASGLPTETNGLSEDHLSERSFCAEPPKPLERIVVRIEVADTGHGIRQKEMYQTKLFSEQSHTSLAPTITHIRGCTFRSLQPDRGWQTTRRQRHWSRIGFGQADRQAKRREVGSGFKGWAWFYLLGRAS